MAAAAELARAKGVRSMVGFTYRRAGDRARPRLVREGRVGEIRHVRAAVPPGLAGRPRVAAHLAAPEGPGGERRAGTSARTSSTSPTSSPRNGQRRQRRHRDLRARAALPGAVHGCRPRPAPVAARSPSTTRRSSSPASAAEPSRPSRPPGSRPGARTRDPAGDQRVARQHRLRLRGHERPPRPRRVGRRPRGRLHPVIVTEASHPYVGNWWPAGHGLGYEHGFTPGGGPHRCDRLRPSPSPPSPTASPSRRCSPPSSTVRRTGPAGPPRRLRWRLTPRRRDCTTRCPCPHTDTHG